MLQSDEEGAAPPDPVAIDRMLCSFQCNNFGITDDLLMPIGAGVFPAGAILNHSCDPNCVVTYAFDAVTMQHVQVFRCGPLLLATQPL